jgi:hypothetical protein
MINRLVFARNSISADIDMRNTNTTKFTSGDLILFGHGEVFSHSCDNLLKKKNIAKKNDSATLRTGSYPKLEETSLKKGK